MSQNFVPILLDVKRIIKELTVKSLRDKTEDQLNLQHHLFLKDFFLTAAGFYRFSGSFCLVSHKRTLICISLILYLHF